MAGFFTNALWQPSQPVFAMMLAVLVGIERLTIVRALGVVVTVTGSILKGLGEPRWLHHLLVSKASGSACLARALCQAHLPPCTLHPPCRT